MRPGNADGIQKPRFQIENGVLNILDIVLFDPDRAKKYSSARISQDIEYNQPLRRLTVGRILAL